MCFGERKEEGTSKDAAPRKSYKYSSNQRGKKDVEDEGTMRGGAWDGMHTSESKTEDVEEGGKGISRGTLERGITTTKEDHCNSNWITF